MRAVPRPVECEWMRVVLDPGGRESRKECTHIHTYTYIHTYIHTYTHIHTQTQHKHTHTHTHRDTDTHTANTDTHTLYKCYHTRPCLSHILSFSTIFSLPSSLSHSLTHSVSLPSSLSLSHSLIHSLTHTHRHTHTDTHTQTHTDTHRHTHTLLTHRNRHTRFPQLVLCPVVGHLRFLRTTRYENPPHTHPVIYTHTPGHIHTHTSAYPTPPVFHYLIIECALSCFRGDNDLDRDPASTERVDLEWGRVKK